MRVHKSLNDDSRGQLILVGGVVVATLIVVMVLVLNGVLFTENFATRDQPEAIDRVVDSGSFIDGTTEELMQKENSQRYNTKGAASANVSADVSQAINSLSERRFEAHGEVLTAEVNNVQDAWTIIQEDDANFSAADSNFGFTTVFGWEMATADGIRDSETTVSFARKLNTSNTSEASDTFRMDVTGNGGSGTTWSVYIFEHPTKNVIALGTSTDADGNPIVACEADSMPANIDWTQMTIDGNQCPFDFAETVGDGPYEIRFKNGDEISGTYKFVLGRGPGTSIGTEGVTGDRTVADTTQGDTAVSDEATAYDGVYSTRVTVTSEGQDLTSETLLFIAPRQPNATTSSEEP